MLAMNDTMLAMNDTSKRRLTLQLNIRMQSITVRTRWTVIKSDLRTKSP